MPDHTPTHVHAEFWHAFRSQLCRRRHHRSHHRAEQRKKAPAAPRRELEEEGKETETRDSATTSQPRAMSTRISMYTHTHPPTSQLIFAGKSVRNSVDNVRGWPEYANPGPHALLSRPPPGPALLNSPLFKTSPPVPALVGETIRHPAHIPSHNPEFHDHELRGVAGSRPLVPSPSKPPPTPVVYTYGCVPGGRGEKGISRRRPRTTEKKQRKQRNRSVKQAPESAPDQESPPISASLTSHST
jgi:hypothetical protein